MNLHVDEVRGATGFAQLEPLWNDLCRTAACDSFFLSHAWFRALVAGLEPEREVIVLVVRDGATVIGVAPLLLQPARWRFLPARQLTLMQNQDSPFADLISIPSHTEAVVGTVLAHLHARGGWHLLHVEKLERRSRTWECLHQALRTAPGLQAPAGRSPILALDGGWDPFWTATSQRFKKTVRNVANRVERLGSIDIANEAETRDAAECWRVFRAVAATSWKSSLPISVTQNPHIARFFETLTATLRDSGRLALWTLRLDGVPIATEYHVRDGRTVYALRSDFDERYSAHSPGAHLNAFIVRTYFDSDLAVYDMGPGDREYKQRWATATTERDAFWLFSRAPYAAALYAMERRAVPHLKRVRAWWRGPQDAQHALVRSHTS